MKPALVSFAEGLTDLVTQGGDRFRALPGGAGLNVARAASALGLRSAWAGCLSRDGFGDALFAVCEQAGLDTGFVQRAEAPPLLAVVEHIDPPRYFFLGEGAADLHFDESLLPAGWAQDLPWAQFGGISLVREPLGTRLETLAARLKAGGTRIAFDPNHRVLMGAQDQPRLLRMLALADLIKFSEDDLRGYFPNESPEAALARLRPLNPGAQWLLSRAADGASLFSPDGEWHAAAPAVQVVDSVGAGDACLAAFLVARLQGEPPERQLRLAVCNGALACQGAGSIAPHRSQLDQLEARL